MAKGKKDNSPDTNMNHISIVENVAMSMMGHLQALNTTCAKQHEAKVNAIEFLHLFQLNQIKTLRDEFED